jgi:hypothetical protein
MAGINSGLEIGENFISIGPSKKIEFNWPILNAVRFQNIIVVCFNFEHYLKDDCNVYAYNLEGEQLWQIHPIPMEYAQNPYAGIRKEKDGNAGLVNSSGRVIIVDPVTGSEKRRDWTK